MAGDYRQSAQRVIPECYRLCLSLILLTPSLSLSTSWACLGSSVLVLLIFAVMHISHLAICLLFLVVTGIAGKPRFILDLLAIELMDQISVADPIDWVNINYVKQAKSNSATSNAQSGIASKAETTAKNGPWGMF